MSGYYDLPIETYLRPPPQGVVRSAYAVEVNPWVRRGDIEAALLYRGTIVASYGYIETRLAELSVRASRIPIYSERRAKFPYKMKNRISFLRAVFSEGPLSEYNGIAVSYLKRFEGMAELRHLAAHARMQVLPDWGVVLQYFEPAEKAIAQQTKRITLKNLEIEAYKAARFSRVTQLLADRLEQTGALPQL